MKEIIRPGQLTRREWAKRISSQWKDACDGMLEAIFQIGRDLSIAKGQLPHGEFTKMIDAELPFGPHVARMHMVIACNPRYAKRDTRRVLPPYYQTLYKMTRLQDETFDRLLEDGTIKPDATFAAINKVLRIETVKADEQRVLNLQPVLGKFRTLVIDPAWDYNWLSIAARAKPGYAMQSIDQLRALDIKQWVDDEAGTHLYCWSTNNFLNETTKLVEHWGAQHRTSLTWIKPPPFGLGSYFRNSTEICLFATFGDTTTRPAASSIATHFTAPRGKHSEKPEIFYDIVRAASYPPYGEGNQRQPRPDFTNLYCPVTEREKEAAE